MTALAALMHSIARQKLVHQPYLLAYQFLSTYWLLTRVNSSICLNWTAVVKVPLDAKGTQFLHLKLLRSVFPLGMLIFQKVFSWVENFKFRELDGVHRCLSSADTDSKKKIKVGVACSWLVRTGMATSSNIFVPSAHKVPGQTCGPCVLVKPATRSNIDGCLLSFVIAHVFSRWMATRDMWIPKFLVGISSAFSDLHLRSHLHTGTLTIRPYSSVCTKRASGRATGHLSWSH